MCAAMVGADPDALDRLAGSFDQQAQALDTTAHRVRALVHASPWQGGVANRFRADWDSTHMPRLRQTSSALRNSAKILRQQAADQRNASGYAGGSSGLLTSGGAAAGANTPGSSQNALLDALKRMIASLGILSGLEDIHVNEALGMLRDTAIGRMLAEAGNGRFFSMVGGVASVAGGFVDALSVYDGVREDDALKFTTGAIGLGSSVVGVLGGAAAAPLTVAASGALLYGDLMIPNSNEELMATQRRALEAQYGGDIDIENPTPEQASYLSERYSGSMGIFASIGDGVDYKMRWLNDPISDAAANFRHWREGSNR